MPQRSKRSNRDSDSDDNVAEERDNAWSSPVVNVNKSKRGKRKTKSGTYQVAKRSKVIDNRAMESEDAINYVNDDDKQAESSDNSQNSGKSVARFVEGNRMYEMEVAAEQNSSMENDTENNEPMDLGEDSGDNDDVALWV